MNVFDLTAKLMLDTSAYKKGLDDAESSTKGSANSIKENLTKSATTAIKWLGAISGAAIGAAAGIFKLAQSTTAYGDAVDKSSQKLGISAEAYQEWDAILQHSGANIESLQRGMRTLNTAISVLASGQIKTAESTTNLQKSVSKFGDYVGESVKVVTNAVSEEASESAKSAEALKELGVAVRSTNGEMRKTEDIFADTITALQNMDDPIQRTALATKIFGEGAMQLGALLNTSAAETEKMRKRVHELGGVMSNDGVKNSAAFTDNMQDLKTAIQGILRTGMERALPDINRALNGVINYISGPEGKRAAETLGEIFSAIARGVRNALPRLLSLLDNGAVKLKIFGVAVAGVVLAIKATTNPIGALISSLALLAGGLAISALASDDLRHKISGLTDEQLDNIDATLNQVAAYKSIEKQRDASFFSIREEERKTRDLWEELKKLADQSGRVDEANRDRAEYILNTLNAALGTEYEMNNGIIGQYGEMGKAIDDLIAKRKAQMIIDANQAAYSEAVTGLAGVQESIADQQKIVDKLYENFWIAWELAKMHGESWERFKITAPSGMRKSAEAYEVEKTKLDDLLEQERKYYEIIARMESAVSALESGDYEKVVEDLNFNEVVNRWQTLLDKGTFTAKDISDLERAKDIAQENAKRYLSNLEGGFVGYTQDKYEELFGEYERLAGILENALAVQRGGRPWREVSGEGKLVGTSAGTPVQVNLVVDGRVFGSAVFDANIWETQRRGVKIVDA